MKRLIVNGDDFGASRGVNLGIVEAHERGILTSASLMVDAPAAEEAAQLASEHPKLGVGLHVVVEGLASSAARNEIEGQFARFNELTGGTPTHLDSHHHVHRDPRLRAAFEELSERHRLPLRDHWGVHYIGRFYAHWDGETHLEAISAEALVDILCAETAEGFNELGCHPGRRDAELRSTYSRERELELEALCSPGVAAAIEQNAIQLATFRDVSRQ
jgi:chitin disaccharide deacetylase